MSDPTYWDSFYAQREAVHYPSPFAEFCLTEYLTDPATILELGPGSGRDAFYFAEHGHSVVGIDQSEVAVASCTERAAEIGSRHRPRFRTGDFTRIDGLDPVDVVYSRFTLHSVDAAGEQRVLDALPGVVRPGGRFLAEARTTNDPLYGQGDRVGEHEFVTDHYRRHVDAQSFLADVVGRGLTVDYFCERSGLATFRGEDPVVMRIAITVGVDRRRDL